MLGWELLAVVPVAFGALFQRVTGLGFALVSAPALVLVFGPDDGVLLVNVASLVSAGAGLVSDWRHIDWRRLIGLLPAGIVGTALGTVVAALLDRAWLEIVVGAVLAAGLTASLVVPAGADRRPSPLWSAGAGVAAGASAALAALPGPAIAIYARLSGWQGRRMAATLQALFPALAIAAIAAKLASGTAALPEAPVWFWAALVLALAVGVAAGHAAASVISPRVAWAIVVVLALVGSAATIVHGIATLSG